MDHILYQIVLSVLEEIMKHLLIIHQWKYILKKIENRILFKIKTGYSLELLTTETMNLLGSTEN